MKWVTRPPVHLDRVASSWLIKRFVDPDAEFIFIDPDNKPWPADAIPYGLPGAELDMHDHEQTTFDRIVTKYGIAVQGIDQLAAIVRAAVRHILDEDQQGASAEVINNGITWCLISEGVLVSHPEDNEVIAASMPLYDAMLAALWGRDIDPRTAKETFLERAATLRDVWQETNPLEPQVPSR